MARTADNARLTLRSNAASGRQVQRSPLEIRSSSAPVPASPAAPRAHPPPENLLGLLKVTKRKILLERSEARTGSMWLKFCPVLIAVLSQGVPCATNIAFSLLRTCAHIEHKTRPLLRGGFASLLFLVAQTFGRVSTLLERAKTAARVRRRLHFMGQSIAVIFLVVGMARENLGVGLRVGFAAPAGRPITRLVKAIMTVLGSLPVFLFPRWIRNLLWSWTGVYGAERVSWRRAEAGGRLASASAARPTEHFLVDTSSPLSLLSSFASLAVQTLRESRPLALTTVAAALFHVAGTFRSQSVLAELCEASAALRTYLRLWVLVAAAVRSARHRRAQSFTNLYALNTHVDTPDTALGGPSSSDDVSLSFLMVYARTKLPVLTSTYHIRIVTRSRNTPTSLHRSSLPNLTSR